MKEESIWKPIETNYMQEVYIPLAIIMLVLLSIVALACFVSYIRFKELTKLGEHGIDRLDKYKRWSRKTSTSQTDKKTDIDIAELENMVKKLIKYELINLMK